MGIKPTPTKMVLLMSAAGLGLSWPGVGLASRDNNTLPSFALTFGVPARGEQGCSSVVPEWLASCPPSGGELLQTIVVKTAALPLPLTPEYLSSAAKVSFRDFDAYARRSTLRSQEAHSGNDEPEPNNEAPLPEVAVAPRIIDESSRDREAVAIAMVLLEVPHEGTGAAAKDSELTVRLATPEQRTLNPAAPGDSETGVPGDVGKLDRSLALAVDSTAAVGIESSDGSVGARASRAPAEAEVAGVAMAASVAGKPSLPDEGETDAAFAGNQASLTEVFAFQADDHSARIAQVSASEDSTPSDLASVERVWTSLAEVLGPPLEESPTAFETSEQQTEAPERDVAFSASVALAAVAPGPVASVSPIDATSHDSNALKRSIAAEDIVVASSHSEKILLSLAALRSGEDSGMDRFGTLAKNTIVVGQADKVLETLALFQSKRPKRAAFACTRGPEEGIQAISPRGSLKTWKSPEQDGTSAVPAFGPEPEVTLDVLPPQAEQSAAPVLRAASAIPTLPDRPAAGPNYRSAFGSDRVALSSDKLDEVRGGFVTDTGLKVSFGIERAVYLNGNLVTTTSLNVADLSKIAGGQAQVTGTGSGSLALVQSGAGNTFSPGSISSTSAGTVIQNTLDNQKINTITRIDAVVNSAGIMRSINLQSSMRSAVIDSLRR